MTDMDCSPAQYRRQPAHIDKKWAAPRLVYNTFQSHRTVSDN